MKIKKRNGSLVDFDITKIKNAIRKAFNSCNIEVSDNTITDIASNVNIWDNIGIEDIQSQVVELLYDWDYSQVAEEYTIYKYKRSVLRESKAKETFLSIINTENNDVTRENANMNSDSPAGMMMKFASETTKPFVDNYILSKETLEAVKNNYIHIHDKDYYLTKSLTCVQTPLDKILYNGFRSGHGESRGAKRIETAATLACISMETTQNEMHGGQAIPAFDFYLAPFVKMTYEEEIDKLVKLLYDQVNDDFLYKLKNPEIDDYIIKELPNNVKPSNFGNGITEERIIQLAINNTVKRVHQSMEGFIHNMNQIHSRGGNQVVFSSINYGTDTSAEGRCIIRELLLSTERGVGNGATAIFPIQIFKVKNGVSHNPEDRNYDLYQLSCRVSAKRFFPNFLNLDSSFNYDSEWNINDNERYKQEVATMGCRTRVYENRFGDKTSVGRGNISFTTINLVKIAIETAKEYGATIDNGNWINPIIEQSNSEFYLSLGDKFINNVLKYVDIVVKQLDERYQFQKTALKKQFPFLMNGIWIDSESLSYNETIESVINQGTLGIGFIGLAEALVALIGSHHGERTAIGGIAQKIGLKLISTMKNRADYWSNELRHNYSILATPAEGLSGKFTKVDQKTYGKLKGITDRDYYTNSNHVPVYYQCSPVHKAKIECPYHKLTLGGHIFYVEIDGDATKNPEALMDIVELAIKNDGGYISINHFQGRCNQCGFETAEKDIKECPHCQINLDILQRITGYLVGTTDRWNHGKLSELNDRIQHK